MKFIECTKNEHVQALWEGVFQIKSEIKFVTDSFILTLLFLFKHFLNLQMWKYFLL